MQRDKLSLWWAYPDDLLSEDSARSCADLLAEDERSRLDRFREGAHKREFLAAHALARRALSHCYPLAPEAWRFTSNSCGKPRIVPEGDPRFSISRSVKFVCCLVARGIEVGVDTEPLQRAEEVAAIASSILSPVERDQYEGLAATEKPNRALTLWTLKEAYTKARGKGLSLPLKKISFTFGNEGEVRLRVDPEIGDDAERWQFCLLSHDGNRIAIAVERVADAHLELLEARPVLAKPKLINIAGIRWFPIAAEVQVGS